MALVLISFVLPVSGCGSGHKSGTATGVDEPPAPQPKEEADAERANERKLRKK